MKTFNNIIKIAAVSTVILFLGACGGGSTNEWGIDSQSLPKCAMDMNDSSSAIIVSEGTEVTATTEGTTIRVWHYENASKLVCVITGSALLEVK